MKEVFETVASLFQEQVERKKRMEKLLRRSDKLYKLYLKEWNEYAREKEEYREKELECNRLQGLMKDIWNVLKKGEGLNKWERERFLQKILT